MLFSKEHAPLFLWSAYNSSRTVVTLSPCIFVGSKQWFLAHLMIRGLVVGRPYFSELPLGKELARVLAEVKFDTIFVNHLWNWSASPLLRFVAGIFMWFMQLTRGSKRGHPRVWHRHKPHARSGGSLWLTPRNVVENHGKLVDFCGDIKSCLASL